MRPLFAYLFMGFLLLCTAHRPYALPEHAVTVTDFSGTTITLDKPAKRIVALAPHIVENLFSAGAGHAIVGAVDYCDYPPEAVNIPRVGAISSHSLEAILALKPDLVIGWNSGHGGLILPKLATLGIPVYASNPLNLKDVAKSIRDFGILTGNTGIAEQQATQYLTRLNRLRARNQGKPTVSVLYQVWNSPLQTLNDQHIISDLIQLCNGLNAFGDLPVVAPKLSIESVLARNPDVIVASGMGEQRPDWLDEWQQWPSLNAVQSQNLFFIPPDIIQRHTARILDGGAQMCEHLDKARHKQPKSPTPVTE
ncbi:cobalamin-binding protein [Teredinibacter purpureus]|uniref:cobalamin-binding protein n=1 Tax=Teredinibacter purpureus TaxID=2731756 RepID=UPI00069810BA|nr:cobalamin-binding protein [Teredinibacter purpureus]